MTRIEWMAFGFVAAVGWLLLGAVVLTAIDDERESLRLWAEDCPLPGRSVWIMAFWPAVLFAALWFKWRKP